MKKNNESFHQQSLLRNDTDVISDDEDHIYTRIPNIQHPSPYDSTLATENLSTIINPKTHTISTNAIDTQQPINFCHTLFTKFPNS